MEASEGSAEGGMTAIVFRSFGPPSVLQLEKGFPKPERHKGEVLVKVHATSVNPIDWKTRRGDIPRFAVPLPKIPGGDLAGVVVEADADSKFKAGDKVFGCSGNHNFYVASGTYAEYAVAHESSLLFIPEGWSFNEAAAVPLVAMTAWQAMEPSMPLAGKRVLVHAGAGGVGIFAIQVKDINLEIAKAQGAFVATTCSGRNVEFVKSLGADQPIDYTKERFEDASALPFDLVVDTIGGDYELRSIKLLKKSGHFAHIINIGFVHQYGLYKGVPLMLYYMARHMLMGFISGPKYTVTSVHHQAQRGLVQVVGLMKAGKVKVVVDQVLPLSEAARAHEISEQGHVRGKLVIHVTD